MAVMLARVSGIVAHARLSAKLRKSRAQSPASDAYRCLSNALGGCIVAQVIWRCALHCYVSHGLCLLVPKEASGELAARGAGTSAVARALVIGLDGMRYRQTLELSNLGVPALVSPARVEGLTWMTASILCGEFWRRWR